MRKECTVGCYILHEEGEDVREWFEDTSPRLHSVASTLSSSSSTEPTDELMNLKRLSGSRKNGQGNDFSMGEDGKRRRDEVGEIDDEVSIISCTCAH